MNDEGAQEKSVADQVMTLVWIFTTITIIELIVGGVLPTGPKAADA